MWAPRCSLLALLLLLSPASAVRDDIGAAEADLRHDLGAAGETELEAEAEAESASGSGLQAGSLMLDRYELLSLLDSNAWPAAGLNGYTKVGYSGRGAFGETWLARDAQTGQQVAIKFFYRKGYNGAITLLNNGNANPQEKAQLREAGAECDTPKNIVQAKNSPEGTDRFALCLKNQVSHPQYAHLVMQVAGTEDLEQYVKTKRTLSPDVVLRLAKMMLEGLVQMEGKYVHRDIKPANLMLYEEGGQVYLRFIDFGLVVREGTSQGVAGTPMFMPPEMWPVVPHNPTITSSFDVYSTGETLYWLICRFTFHEKIFNQYGGRGEMEIKKGLTNTNPRSMCSPQPAFASLFSLVADKMLKAMPNQRMKASALLADPIFKGVDTSKKGAAAPQVVDQKPQGGAQGNQKPQQPNVPGQYQPRQPQGPVQNNRPFQNIYDQINNQRPQQPNAARPYQPFQPAGGRPAAVINQAPQKPVAEVPQEPTLLDRCHDDKAFWFGNVAKCCLMEKYDPKREAVCQSPCGPRVGYSNGKCASGCQVTSAGQFQFSHTKFCCVATVWRDKCIYPGMPHGEGWRWMAADKL